MKQPLTNDELITEAYSSAHAAAEVTEGMVAGKTSPTVNPEYLLELPRSLNCAAQELRNRERRLKPKPLSV